MTTRYLCVHCDVRFEHTGEDEARCPKCLRRNGLEKLPEVAPKQGLPVWAIPTLVVAIVAGVAGGYVAWSRSTPDAVEGEAPMRPLTTSELRGHLREENADDRRFGALFAADDAVERLGAEGARGKSSALDKARGVVARLRAMAQAGHFVPSELHMPHEAQVRTASETARAIARPGARVEVYPFEIAVLAVAALRAEGVDAMLAEAFSFPGEESPPDPSGRLGYYVVAVYPGDVGEGAPTLFDPYGGRTRMPTGDAFRVLADTQAVAAALDALALHSLVTSHDPSGAVQTIQAALELDPRSAAARSVRGAILVASGAFDEGVAELESAAQIRPDAPRRANLAGLFVATGDVDRAEREIDQALDDSPGFAAGHATRAAVRMARGDTNGARMDLQSAERLEPRLFTLPLLWAEYYLRTGDTMQAAGRAREAVARRPDDVQTHLSAARVYREAGLVPDMQAEARKVLELVPPEQREAMRAQLLEVLGPDAFLDVATGQDAAGETPPVDPDALPDVPDLHLGGSTPLLGGGQRGGQYRLGGGGGQGLHLTP